MEDASHARHDIGEGIHLDHGWDDAVQDELNEVRELANMKKFLQEENETYGRQIEALTNELDGMEISIAATEATIAAYEEKRKRCNETIEKLKARKEVRTAEVNRIHLRIKAAREDEQSTGILIYSLRQELDEIRAEREIIQKRLASVRTGIDQISQDRQTRLPHLKEYDDVCRQVRTVLKDALNRMEVSLKMRQR